MSQLTIEVPTPLKAWIEARTAEAGYIDAGAYVRQLIQREQDAYAEDVARVRALIDEGLASGILEADGEDILDEIIAGIPDEDG